MADHVDIVFAGPPGPEGNRFIGVEDILGRTIRFGHWIERGDGRWALRITPADFEKRSVGINVNYPTSREANREWWWLFGLG